MGRTKTAKKLIKDNLGNIDSLLVSIERELQPYRNGEKEGYGAAGDLYEVTRQLFELWEFLSGAER